jgi:hypothetical protein
MASAGFGYGGGGGGLPLEGEDNPIGGVEHGWSNNMDSLRFEMASGFSSLKSQISLIKRDLGS